jgi:YHS domain-containing protein
MTYEAQVELGQADQVCAVCFMPLSGIPATRIQHLGKDMVFCSPECLAEFYKDPEKYVLPEEEEEE